MSSYKIYLVGSEKGGVGKTTLAFNLAVLRAKAGHSTLLVDTDLQESSSIWSAMRAENAFAPLVPCVQKHGKLGFDLVQLREKFDVIVDAGGRDSLELRQAIAVADEWLVPVTPSQLDLASIAKQMQLRADIVERMGSAGRARMVINRVALNTVEGAAVRPTLAEIEDETMSLMQCQISDRVAVRRAVMAGCGISELTGKNASEASVAEFYALYFEFFGEPYRDAKADK
jgi:chromosome partitioning protein